MLVTVKQLMASMGVSASLEADMKPTLISVIAKAEMRAEIELGSPISALQGVDTFITDPDLFCGIVLEDGLRLKLSRKFVRNTPTHPVVVTVDGEPLSDDDTVVDLLSGVVSIPETLRGKKVRVSYTSGFSDGDDLPAPLREGLLLLCTMVASMNQVGEKESGAQEASKRAGDMALGFLSQYKINPPFSYRPMSSTQTPL